MAKVNRSELASLLDCSLPTVTSKVTKGMPFLQKGGRGKEWMFDTAEVIGWIKLQAITDAVGDLTLVGEDEIKKRKLAAETTIVEIEAAKKKGEVVLLVDVEKTITDLAIELRAMMMLVPQRVAAHDPELKRVIEDEIKEALTDALDIELDYDS